MASKTCAISVQIDKADKKQVTDILQKLGVSMSALVNMTIKQVIMKKGIPFDIALSQENDELHKYFTEQELDETAKELVDMEKHPEKYKKYNNVSELFEALENDD